jgi:hypothetical protein
VTTTEAGTAAALAAARAGDGDAFRALLARADTTNGRRRGEWPGSTHGEGTQMVDDEDTFVMPKGLLRDRVPRRSTANGAVLMPSTSALDDAARLLADNTDLVRATLALAGTDPGLAAAGTAHLAGRPSPVGAAATVFPIARTLNYNHRDKLVMYADAWLLAHGPVFAAEAVTALMSMTLDSPSSHYVATKDDPLRWLVPKGGERTMYPELMRRVGHRLRALLAGAPEPEYAEVVAALAGHRGQGPAQRVATSLLAPDEIAWVTADCAEVAAVGSDSLTSTLLYAVSTPAQYEVIKDSVQVWWVQYTMMVVATIVDAMGPAVAGILDGWLSYEHGKTDFRRRIASTIAQLPGDEPFRLLLERVDDKVVQPAVLEAARRFPRRGLRMLAADPRRVPAEMLRAHVGGHPELAAESDDPKIAALLAEFAAVVDAPADALPPVLADPPWRRERATRKPVVITDLHDDAPPAVEWLPGERDRWLAGGTSRSWLRRDDTWEEHAKRIRRGEMHWTDGSGFFRNAPEDLARPVIRTWRPREHWDAANWTPHLAARFELDALPALLDLARRSPATCAPALLPYASAQIALLMADWFGRLKLARATAQEWLVRHAATTAQTLVPLALSKPGSARRRAERTLRLLATNGRRDAVSTAAASYGPEVGAAIEALLDVEPLDVLPPRIPAVPGWADPAALPRIRLRSGGAVPVAASAHVLTMLAMSRLDDPYAGLDQVREACEPADLAEFVWSLFRLWQASGSPSKDGWVLDALGLLGDDETVRRFAPVIRAWPGEGGHSRAVAGLDVLAAIGTDVALMHLNGIARKVKFKALRERASEKIDEVAAGLGLSAEQLADRLVPDLGLDPAGSLRLDYGPRQFTVGFDEQLKPYALDGAGKRRKDLPKPGAGDDPALAPEAHKRFAALKKDVRTIAADQIHRLERAMVGRRRWSAAEFRALFVGHPLLVHLAQRIVWLVHDGDGVGAVRVAEDRTLADSADEPVTLPEGASVSVAHPLELADRLGAWAQVFADYEILQPFPQLAREVYALAPDERPGDIARFTGRAVESVRLLGLESRGWQRDSPQDAGWQGHFELTLPDGTSATLGMDPGMIVGNVTFAAEQKITGVGIRPAGGTLDPVVLSEIIRDVELATG